MKILTFFAILALPGLTLAQAPEVFGGSPPVQTGDRPPVYEDDCNIPVWPSEGIGNTGYYVPPVKKRDTTSRLPDRSDQAKPDQTALKLKAHYDAGYKAGKENGFQEGLKKGKEEAEPQSDRWDDGYSEGLADATTTVVAGVPRWVFWLCVFLALGFGGLGGLLIAYLQARSQARVEAAKAIADQEAEVTSTETVEASAESSQEEPPK